MLIPLAPVIMIGIFNTMNNCGIYPHKTLYTDYYADVEMDKSQNAEQKKSVYKGRYTVSLHLYKVQEQN
jgi:hypothetical protein